MAKLPILLYHRLIKDQTELQYFPPEDRPYCLLSGAFTAQLDYLVQAGCRGIAVRDVAAQEDTRVVGLTFDDGLESDYALAFPELLKRQLYATFYVVTGYVGKKGYMPWHHLRELAGYGMEIGSHSATHRCFLDLDHHEIVQELRHSKQTLEDRLGEPVTSFSVPFGFVNRMVIEAALAEGYQTVCLSRTRLADTQARPRVYGRYALRWGDAPGVFAGIVRQERWILLRIACKEGSKAVGKRLLGRGPWLAFRQRYLARKSFS